VNGPHITAPPHDRTSRPALGALGGESESRRRQRQRRRRGRLALLAGAVPLAGLVVGTTAVVSATDDGDSEGDEAGVTTAAVEVRDLVLTDEYSGDIGFGVPDPAITGRAGVVTGITPAGTVVGQGDTLFDIDLQPTVLLHGEIPAFRDLDVDADPGADVAQLEAALVDLGFGDDLTVDDDFTPATARAVAEWEEALGRADPDGEVTLGDVVFAPADVRIATVTAQRGTQVQPGAEIVQVTATSKVVTLELGVDEIADIEAGTPVTIELPDGTDTTGTIAAVASAPTESDPGNGQGGAETYAVTVHLDDQSVAAAFESGAVDVTVERSRTDGVTAVPVIALLALREGGYGVQVVDSAAPEGHRLIAVEVGTVADGWVEVGGEGIEPGVDVVVPA
jgi:peptidoglycan hydrolase-like protein with peptidoglycan-binding domain